MKYKAAVEYIMSIPKFTKKHSLAYTADMMELLGNPQNGEKIIHVAGTNGKGSVCAFLSSILQASGKSVGMFTSPHLVYVNERFRINGKSIDNQQFLFAFHKVYESVRSKDEHPTFFEFLFFMALCIFKQAKTDYWILETGLGGRLDATNAVKNPALTIITPISRDHMEYLGNTVEAIAAEKAGILKEEVPLVYWSEDENVRTVIHQHALDKHCPELSICKRNVKFREFKEKHIAFSVYCSYYDNVDFSIPAAAWFQAENAALAITAFAVLEGTKEKLQNSIIQKGLAESRWQGRMEEILPGIFLDGAHNEAGIYAFMESVDMLRKHRKPPYIYLLCSMVKEKEIEVMERLLGSNQAFNKIYVTSLKTERSCSQDVLAKELKKWTDAEILTFANVKDAWLRAAADKQEQDILFCAGSLYLVGEIKELLLQT